MFSKLKRRNEDDHDEEENSKVSKLKTCELEDVFQEVQVSRPLRDEKQEILTALRVLRSGNLTGFFGLSVVVEKFAPTVELLKTFKHGEVMMTQLWEFYLKCEIAIIAHKAFEGTCTACGQNRTISYTLYHKGKIFACLGRDCYEIKMQRLFYLADHCLRGNLDADNFHEVFEERLNAIRNAPLEMMAKYKKFN